MGKYGDLSTVLQGNHVGAWAGGSFGKNPLKEVGVMTSEYGHELVKAQKRAAQLQRTLLLTNSARVDAISALCREFDQATERLQQAVSALKMSASSAHRHHGRVDTGVEDSQLDPNSGKNYGTVEIGGIGIHSTGSEADPRREQIASLLGRLKQESATLPTSSTSGSNIPYQTVGPHRADNRPLNEIYASQGYDAFHRKDYRTMEQYYAAAARLSPNEPSNFNFLGYAEANQGKHSQALDSFMKARDLVYGNPSKKSEQAVYASNVAMMYFALGNRTILSASDRKGYYEVAQNFLREAMQLAPNKAEYKQEFGSVFQAERGLLTN